MSCEVVVDGGLGVSRDEMNTRAAGDRWAGTLVKFSVPSRLRETQIWAWPVRGNPRRVSETMSIQNPRTGHPEGIQPRGIRASPNVRQGLDVGKRLQVVSRVDPAVDEHARILEPYGQQGKSVRSSHAPQSILALCPGGWENRRTMNNADETAKTRVSTGSVQHGAQGGDGEVDVRERGALRDGVPQVMDRRLFMQLLVLDAAPDVDPAGAGQKLCAGLEASGIPSVVYADVSAPGGFGVLTWSQDPTHFVTLVRPAVQSALRVLRQRQDWAMFGRTYSTGYETDLVHWLLDRPVQTVLNPLWPWAVWYPLRRVGGFNRLEPREQGAILREHGTIGRAYGEQDLAHDVRLACHGIDARDNEFVVGLVGKELHPLSHVVQAMRRTRQTAEFMAQMGPFFVGRTVWQSAGKVSPG